MTPPNQDGTSRRDPWLARLLAPVRRIWRRGGIRARVLSLVVASALVPGLLVGLASYLTARTILIDKVAGELSILAPDGALVVTTGSGTAAVPRAIDSKPLAGPRVTIVGSGADARLRVRQPVTGDERRLGSLVTACHAQEGEEEEECDRTYRIGSRGAKAAP